MLTPSSAVLFPSREVIFICNTTANTVLWKIGGQLHTGSNLPNGTNLINLTTVAVNMSPNATTYACAIPVGADLNSSNIVTLFLAG